MKSHKTSLPTAGRQMSLMFEPSKVDAMNELDGVGAITILAQILTQAAGLIVGELDDDQR